MPENKYVVSAKARADLKAIAKYIIEKLGEGQSLNYAQGFKTILADLGNNPELGKRYVAVKDKMLSRCRYKAHVIFYYVENGKIFIVRVLGGRMDFPKHLK